MIKQLIPTKKVCHWCKEARERQDVTIDDSLMPAAGWMINFACKEYLAKNPDENCWEPACRLHLDSAMIAGFEHKRIEPFKFGDVMAGLTNN